MATCKRAAWCLCADMGAVECACTAAAGCRRRHRRRLSVACRGSGGLLRGGSGFGSRRWALPGEDTESDRSKGREPGFYNQLAI